MNVVVAGGGSAGHIEPALAFADAVVRLAPDARVTALGTERGLDTTLIPARGYPLELIPPVPLPRRPSGDLLRLPGRVRGAVRRVREVLADVDADVVVGFGGYVALPAYLGARGRVPIVVHEANARAGLANRVGARFAARVVAAVPGTGCPAPRSSGSRCAASITTLDRARVAGAAPAPRSGCPPTGRCCWCSAARRAPARSTPRSPRRCPGCCTPGSACCTPTARRAPRRRRPRGPGYVALPYIDDMDLAYAAADAVLGRCGAMTVAEVSAVGLPACLRPAAARQRRAGAQRRARWSPRAAG